MPSQLPWPLRVALYAYPARFRAQFGADLSAALATQWRARLSSPGLAAPRLCTVLVAQTVGSGLAERWAVVTRQAWRSQRPHLYASTGRHASMWDSLRFDLIAAVRGLAAARAFTLLTVLALALGLGANSAVFAVVNGVLLKPLPYAAPEQLAMLWSENPRLASATNPLSPANFDDLRRMSRSFETLDYGLSFLVVVAVQGHEDQGVLQVMRVGTSMLDLLGLRPQLGRSIGAGDRDVAVISDRAWRTHFGADPGVIGRTIVVSGGESLTIVGVAPPEFLFPLRDMLWQAGTTTPKSAEMWVPMPFEGPRFVDPKGGFVRSFHALLAVGRLRPGVTAAAADAEMRSHARTLAEQHPDTNTGWGARVVALHDQATGSVRMGMLVLQAGALSLLLMAAVNVTNLVLARSLARQRELAVRAALGASARQLVRQALIESLLLAGLALVLSAAAGRWMLRTLVALAPATVPRLADVNPGVETWLASAGLALLIGVALAIVPAWVAAHTDVRGVLQDGSRGAAGTSRSGGRLRTTLVVAEVALAVVITVQAGLLFRSFAALIDTDPGFKAEHLLTFEMNTPEHITALDARRAFYDEWFARIAALPGVEAVGGTTRIPLGSTSVTTSVRAEGNTSPPAALPEVEFRRGSPDYFRAMGMPMRRGRSFLPSDRPTDPPSVVVNETMARVVFGAVDPIGRRIQNGPDATGPWLTVIGVVGDVHHTSLEAAPPPELYVNLLHNPANAPFMAIRTTGDPLALVESVRAAARALDPRLALYDIRTMSDLRQASLAERRFVLTLVSGFGLLALLLAVVGVYGVLALVVAERTSELSLRIALGAAPASVARLVVGQALRLAGIGVAIGLAAAAGTATAAKSVLVGVTAYDPVTFVVVPVLLLAGAAAAAAAPARRALRSDPAAALRA
ncbi:MAG: ADOP family duplicated permease [Acidobacteriota bacterium]